MRVWQIPGVVTGIVRLIPGGHGYKSQTYGPAVYGQIHHRRLNRYNTGVKEPVMEQLRLPITPNYTVRVSRRAKQAQLHVSGEGSIEVIIPKRFSPARVPAFVAASQDWLDQALSRIQAQQRSSQHALPQDIHLRA